MNQNNYDEHSPDRADDAAEMRSQAAIARAFAARSVPVGGEQPAPSHADLLIRIRERIENAAASTQREVEEHTEFSDRWGLQREAAGLRRALVIIARCTEPDPAAADRGEQGHQFVHAKTVHVRYCGDCQRPESEHPDADRGEQGQ